MIGLGLSSALAGDLLCMNSPTSDLHDVNSIFFDLNLRRGLRGEL